MGKNKSGRVYDTAWRDKVCARFKRIYVIVMAALVPTFLGTMGWAVTQHNDALLALPFTLVGVKFSRQSGYLYCLPACACVIIPVVCATVAQGRKTCQKMQVPGASR